MDLYLVSRIDLSGIFFPWSQNYLKNEKKKKKIFKKSNDSLMKYFANK